MRKKIERKSLKLKKTDFNVYNSFFNKKFEYYLILFLIYLCFKYFFINT